jgi:hypothetical protein
MMVSPKPCTSPTLVLCATEGSPASMTNRYSCERHVFPATDGEACQLIAGRWVRNSEGGSFALMSKRGNARRHDEMTRTPSELCCGPTSAAIAWIMLVDATALVRALPMPS